MELDMELEYKEQELGWGGLGWGGLVGSDCWDCSGLGGRLAIQAAATNGGALSVWNTKAVCYFRELV